MHDGGYGAVGATKSVEVMMAGDGIVTGCGEGLERRRIARIGDTVVCDKGYYSYRNYTQGIREFKIVPRIFARKNFSPLQNIA